MKKRCGRSTVSDKPVLIGVGNLMYGDDAFGVLFAEAAARCAYGINVVNGGTNLFYLSSIIEEYERVVFVDVLDQEFGDVGDVVVLEIKPEVLRKEEVVELFSRETYAHTVTPAHVIAIASFSGRFRGKSWIVGVVGTNRNFASKISGKVLDAVSEVCLKINRVLGGEKDVIDCICLEEEFRTLLENHYKELEIV